MTLRIFFDMCVCLCTDNDIKEWQKNVMRYFIQFKYELPIV